MKSIHACFVFFMVAVMAYVGEGSLANQSQHPSPLPNSVGRQPAAALPGISRLAPSWDSDSRLPWKLMNTENLDDGDELNSKSKFLRIEPGLTPPGGDRIYYPNQYHWMR